jgi:hypothetical protein
MKTKKKGVLKLMSHPVHHTSTVSLRTPTEKKNPAEDIKVKNQVHGGTNFKTSQWFSAKKKTKPRKTFKKNFSEKTSSLTFLAI